MANQYDVSFVIPHPVHLPLIVPTLAAAESKLFAKMGFHALIGRDVLSRCMFVYDGVNNFFYLAY